MPISGRVARSDTHLAWRKSGGGRLTAAAHGHVRSRERRHVAAHQHAAATAQDGSSTVAALRRGESRSFTFKLNSSYLGRFYMPQVSVEAMYDGSIYARDLGNWVEVRRAGPEG